MGKHCKWFQLYWNCEPIFGQIFIAFTLKNNIQSLFLLQKKVTVIVFPILYIWQPMSCKKCLSTRKSFPWQKVTKGLFESCFKYLKSCHGKEWLKLFSELILIFTKKELALLDVSKLCFSRGYNFLKTKTM